MSEGPHTQSSQYNAMTNEICVCIQIQCNALGLIQTIIWWTVRILLFSLKLFQYHYSVVPSPLSHLWTMFCKLISSCLKVMLVHIHFQIRVSYSKFHLPFFLCPLKMKAWTHCKIGCFIFNLGVKLLWDWDIGSLIRCWAFQ